MSGALLEVENLRVHFPIGGGGWRRPRWIKAVDGVSFRVEAGQTLGVVGESGCGKSTLGRALLGLIPATGGRVCWAGQDLLTLDQRSLRPLRRELQIIFQDPLASLDPRMTVGESIAEPLKVHYPDLDRAARRVRAAQMLARVGLAPEHLNRYPHEFSGGQCQRIGIARAMMPGPRLMVCDEPVSALDVSIQAQIINLLAALQRDFGVSLIFISHNLAVVRHISQRILVLYLGKMMELADRDRLYASPRHPYTRALIAAVPIPDPLLERARCPPVLAGELPSPLNPPSGCPFRTRCPHAAAVCTGRMPALERVDEGHWVACHRWREL